MPFPLIGAAIGTLGRIGGTILKKNAGGAGRAVARIIGGKSGAAKRAATAAGKVAAGGAAFEAGSRVARTAFGDDDKPRRRRINPGNVRALRRAMSRVSSFAKLAKKTITFTKTVRMKSRRGGR